MTDGSVRWFVAPRPVARVAGEIDIDNAGTVFRSIRNGTAGGRVVVELSRVTFMDSTALGQLLRLSREVSVWLVAPDGGEPRRLLDVTGVPILIPTFETLEDALDAEG
jgi:anti-anti-sigma factor